MGKRVHENPKLHAMHSWFKSLGRKLQGQLLKIDNDPAWFDLFHSMCEYRTKRKQDGVFVFLEDSEFNVQAGAHENSFRYVPWENMIGNLIPSQLKSDATDSEHLGNKGKENQVSSGTSAKPPPTSRLAFEGNPESKNFLSRLRLTNSKKGGSMLWLDHEETKMQDFVGLLEKINVATTEYCGVPIAGHHEREIGSIMHAGAQSVLTHRPSVAVAHAYSLAAFVAMRIQRALQSTMKVRCQPLAPPGIEDNRGVSSHSQSQTHQNHRNPSQQAPLGKPPLWNMRRDPKQIMRAWVHISKKVRQIILKRLASRGPENVETGRLARALGEFLDLTPKYTLEEWASPVYVRALESAREALLTQISRLHGKDLLDDVDAQREREAKQRKRRAIKRRTKKIKQAAATQERKRREQIAEEKKLEAKRRNSLEQAKIRPKVRRAQTRRRSGSRKRHGSKGGKVTREEALSSAQHIINRILLPKVELSCLKRQARRIKKRQKKERKQRALLVQSILIERCVVPAFYQVDRERALQVAANSVSYLVNRASLQLECLYMQRNAPWPKLPERVLIRLSQRFLPPEEAKQACIVCKSWAITLRDWKRKRETSVKHKKHLEQTSSTDRSGRQGVFSPPNNAQILPLHPFKLWGDPTGASDTGSPSHKRIIKALQSTRLLPAGMGSASPPYNAAHPISTPHHPHTHPHPIATQNGHQPERPKNDLQNKSSMTSLHPMYSSGSVYNGPTQLPLPSTQPDATSPPQPKLRMPIPAPQRGPGAHAHLFAQAQVVVGRLSSDAELLSPASLRLHRTVLDGIHACRGYFSQAGGAEVVQTLHKNVHGMARALNSLSLERRPWQMAVVNALRVVVTDLWPTARVEVYGSFATQLCAPSSDIDLVVCDVAAHYQSILSDIKPRESCVAQLARHLRRQKWVQIVKTIERAAVPIVKVTATYQEAAGIQLDLSFDSPSHRGLSTCAFVRGLCAEYPMLVPLTLVLKQFLVTRGLNDPYSGGLSSYGLVLMITRVLQRDRLHRRYLKAMEAETESTWNIESNRPITYNQVAKGIKTKSRHEHKTCEVSNRTNASDEEQYERLKHFFSDDIELGRLFVTFLVEYGRVFEPIHHAVSVFNQAEESDFVFAGAKYRGLFLGDPLAIIDPFDPTNNIGRTCYGIGQIQKAFDEALSQIQSSMDVDQKTNSKLRTPLGAVFNTTHHESVVRFARQLWKRAPPTPDSKHSGALPTPAPPMAPAPPPPNAVGHANMLHAQHGQFYTHRSFPPHPPERLVRSEKGLVNPGYKNNDFSAETRVVHPGAYPSQVPERRPPVDASRTRSTKSISDKATDTENNDDPAQLYKDVIEEVLSEVSKVHASAKLSKSQIDQTSEGKGKQNSQSLINAWERNVKSQVRELFNLIDTRKNEMTVGGHLETLISIEKVYGMTEMPQLLSFNADNKRIWWMHVLSRLLLMLVLTPPSNILYYRSLEWALTRRYPSLRKQVVILSSRAAKVVIARICLRTGLKEGKVSHDGIDQRSKSFIDASMLRTLGSWLGAVTLSNDRPVWLKYLDIGSSLQTVLMEEDQIPRTKLHAVVSFTVELLSSCVESSVFRLPNPWLAAILRVLRDIRNRELNVPLETEFAIDILFRRLGVKNEDLT